MGGALPAGRRGCRTLRVRRHFREDRRRPDLPRGCLTRRRLPAAIAVGGATAGERDEARQRKGCGQGERRSATELILHCPPGLPHLKIPSVGTSTPADRRFERFPYRRYSLPDSGGLSRRRPGADRARGRMHRGGECRFLDRLRLRRSFLLRGNRRGGSDPGGMRSLRGGLSMRFFQERRAGRIIRQLSLQLGASGSDRSRTVPAARIAAGRGLFGRLVGGTRGRPSGDGGRLSQRPR
ncbi:hypothetical protein LzC2_00020 [Planctomycetes bacterium LzC2]|uniref:Uncharacterized protein n=1 Tax=Alienimonas chondri TaxID=2681879 RepID=A0ABX1V6Q6_9PLAN|nr:hypothetical protein [Alienimonas chondri]